MERCKSTTRDYGISLPSHLGYRRAALIIWPPRSNASILYSDARGFGRACESLALFLGEHPTPPQLALIDFVFEH